MVKIAIWNHKDSNTNIDYPTASIIRCNSFSDLKKCTSRHMLNGILIDEVVGIDKILKSLYKLNSFIAPPICLLGSKRLNTNNAMNLAKKGIDLYFRKPLDINKLLHDINSLAPKKIDYKDNSLNCGSIQSTNSIHINKEISRLADSSFNLHIKGETGTGKGYYTKMIHKHSERKSRPLISVNCAAIPDSLFESEFFGTCEGAYTDSKNRKGFFEQVSGGTLFLDEIGELSQYGQSKLLKVVEERFYYPLGSSNVKRFNGRIITASHRNLKKMSEKGQFRKDLYYRLNILQLDIPPLRKRLSELPYHVKRILEAHGTGKSLSHRALIKLLNHKWQGNIRELQSVILRAIVLSKDSPWIELCHIQF